MVEFKINKRNIVKSVKRNQINKKFSFPRAKFLRVFLNLVALFTFSKLFYILNSIAYYGYNPSLDRISLKNLGDMLIGQHMNLQELNLNIAG
jgi:hypothetical protein